ncbi:MAG: hypothetical protein OXE79_03860 [Acidimicrobiaceae bacterium]|nr:hypothetical protein [Acidimicrobiaceae bacterium]MCY4294521.1 hypothetical protein [Acidimicrobiaceae bacterium]
MSSIDELFHQAHLKMLRAERCREVAEMLDRRGQSLVERHEPVVDLHRVEVWRGRAASASRTRLRHVIGRALYSLQSDLATISRALRSEAASLEQQAATLRRQAQQAETSAAAHGR